MGRQKLPACLWIYARVTSGHHHEFAEYISNEFRTVLKRFVLVRKFYSPEEWDNLILLMGNLSRFVERMDEWGEVRVKLS